MKIELDLVANKNCTEVMLDVYCDDRKIFSTSATDVTHTVEIDVDDQPAQHQLRLVMSGKTRQHTKLDDQGNIAEDVFFTVSRLEFEELDMREIFCLGRPCYRHSFNGTRSEFLDEFYGFIGCNGTVELIFETPVFLWLNNYLVQ